MSLSPVELRADVAALLGVSVEALDDAAPLTDQGLDSMRLITLIEQWRAKGTEVDFFTISSLPCLRDWESYVCGEGSI
ncbi:phosphopantetheine-binding protein [Corynebacterium aquilae]|uniref:Carrier domain-containing protein n=1 Tax=Corynebacterium aquilae DSM 44791 TaxID=1431546 RepID=A0A1L7CF49_9CORY|nr:phosphopantetheine-binding protein [Corynebacterium aquilae]APT84447.1 hypothetical protein CAQU_04495 [Corynebacterium aquilae DSM 44791]